MRPQRRKKVYNESDLDIPTLNGVVPKTRIKRRKNLIPEGREGHDKVLQIIEQVSANKEGEIRSKLQRIRDLEGIRERKRIEMEGKEAKKREMLERKKLAVSKK